MKFGIRKRSLRKRVAARTSVKRMARHNLGLKAPRGFGWFTNPKRAAYNRVYNRTSRRSGCVVVLLVTGVVATFLAIGVALASTVTVTGPAIIVDGDTIIIGQQTIRLHGIDAPEVGQKCETATGRDWPCGRAAMEHLAGLIEGRAVTCAGNSFDDYDRLVATCTHAEADFHAAMVRAGMAWAFVQFSDDYVPDEQLARTARVGVWQGSAQAPWNYRAARWEVAAQEAPEGCPIKGNISPNGRIYHAPWSPWYGRTKIDESKGERWFCSEREALDAGWRAPRWR